MAKEGWSPILIQQNVIDVRVAQYLLTPDTLSVTDSPEVDGIFRTVFSRTFSVLGRLDTLGRCPSAATHLRGAADLS